MYINQMAEGSPVYLRVIIDNRILEFETVIRQTYHDQYRREVYYCGCDLIEQDSKKVSFGKNLMSAMIKNEADNREYKFSACYASFNKDRSLLLLFSHIDAEPVNHRNAYRIPCSLHTVIQIGNNRKAIEGCLHDISYTGIGMVFLTEDFPNLEVGQLVSASIFDQEEHVYKVTGQLVRFINDFADNRTLIGVEFIEPSKAIAVLVTKLHRRELRVRRDKAQ